MSTATTYAPARPLINPWIIACTVMLATFMEVLDTSVANVSLRHIAGSFSASSDESTWVLTSYLVSNAIVLPMGGWFAMLMGRKRFYMICVGIFTISSFLCGIAPSLGALIFFRVMQGIGGGALQPMSQAILVESFPREKQGAAAAFYGMGVLVAPIIGPTLGGWITDNFTWRWIFLINIPVGILSLLLTSMLIFDPPYMVRRGFKDGLRIDYIGFGLLAIGLGALEIMLDEGQRNDWFASNFIVFSAVVAVFCLIAVVIWELRQEHPIIDFHILKERNFAVSVAAMFILGLTLYSSTALLPMFMQTLLGYTATLAGMVVSPGGIATLLSMPLVALLLRKVQPRWLVMAGAVFCSTGLIMMSNFTLGLDFPHAIKARLVQSLGFGLLFVPINTAAFALIPREKTNYASGLVNLARNIGGSTGIASAVTMIARRSQFHQQRLIEHLTPYDANYQAALHSTSQMLQSAGVSGPDAALKAQGMIYGEVQRQSTVLAFSDAFWFFGVLFVIVIPLMFLMKRIAPQKGPMVME
jgi:DHA2 family multidrug resistance protein